MRLILLLFLITVNFLGGCSVVKKPIEVVDNLIGATFFPVYRGPKARIIMADFEVLTAKVTSDLVVDLKNLLINALIKTGRFEIAENTASTSLEDGVKQLIVAIKLLDFEPFGAGGKDGAAGAGSASRSSLVTLLGPSYNRSYLSLEVRVIDASSLRVLSSQIISQQATGSDVLDEEYLKQKVSGQGLAAYLGTSMEEAVSRCLNETVEFLIARIPSNYYLYPSKKGDKNG